MSSVNPADFGRILRQQMKRRSRERGNSWKARALRAERLLREWRARHGRGRQRSA